MNYTEKTKPGMMDPFYYEESVGLFYILDMLNQDNHIDYVELQGLYPLGLDDVVITYENGDKCFIQVKHTRAGDTITFGDIVSVDNSKKNEDSRCSFLSQIAKAWIQEKEQYTNSKVYIVTNRKAGEFSSTAKKNGTVKRPPLKIFLDELKEQTDKANSFSDITFSDDKEEAWREWCGQLEGIEKDEDKLYFLKNLHFKTNQEDLDELRKTIKGKIQNYFSISEEGAEVLLGKLDHALIEWTTSSRDSSKITVEKLYSALSANEDIINYNHEFISQNPFFDSRKNFVEKIESDLKNGDEKILFISGGPGTGKTNIISKLCERKEGCIDIRYHAYEPINPAKEYLPLDVSERVKKEIFWDTLLNQLRNVLKGKLYKYKVPVSNSFLTLEEKRNKFFEIASEYAKEINRDFIIAIDGIDHAARAGVVEDTFLHTMPSPDYLPKNIKIVIAGQPKEYYTTYPLWLYGNSSYIKEYKVPEIQPSDVESLVNNKCEKISNSDKNLIIEIICRYAAGNTLAAVFAVQEALNSANPQNLEESLKKRKLSGNIQEYYQRIWEDAIKRVQIPFINYKMAGIFAFFNEPITAQKLSCIFKDEPISNSSWNNILKSLSPLLIEKDGLYTIMHNDVRVYLSSLIGRDHEHVKEVYSKLADYYLSQTEKSIGYYHDSIRFLKFAGRFQEVFEVFTSEFIMNSFVNGVELVEIINTSNELMKLVISENELDWNKLLSLTMSYLTIEHIKNCKEENGNDYVDKRKGEIEIHKYECHTLPASEWNLTILEEVFCLVNTLFDNDEINRANRLFINWFGDVKILDILKLINDEEDNHIFYEKRKLAKQIGKACVNTEKFDLVMETLEIKEDFLFYTIEEIEKSIIDKYHHQKLEESLDSLEVLSVDPIVDGIKKLIEQNRYEELVAIRDSLKKRSLLNEKGKMILAFLKIITRDAEWDENQSRTLWEEIESLELPDNQYENRMIYYSIYTLVSAYLQNKSRSCIAQDTTERYVNIHKNSDSRYYLLFFNAVAFLGKWIKERDKKEILESKEDIIQIIKNLYIKNWGLSEIEYEIPSIKACLLKAFIILSQKESSQFQNNLNGVLDKIFEGNPANKLIDPGMLYYMNNIPRMQAWVDEWLQRNGRIWAEPIEIRNEIIKYFLDVKEKYDKRNELSLRGAEELVKWSTLSSASTMEYCLFNMLDWYNKLVDNYPQYISSYGNAVKQISDIIEIIGSNRNEYYINCKIYSDWGTEGFKGIQQVLQNPYLLNQCISEPSYLIEMLIGNLKEKKCDKKELLTIWAIGIGLLDWRKEDDYDSIVSLQRAIEICAFNNGINNIKMSLSELGPAYIDLYSDPVKYRIPSRWCDNSSFIKLDDAEEIVDAFIENKENYQNSEVASAIESLYLEKRLSKEKIEKLFYIELTKDNYGLRNNSILEFLFKVGDDKDINDFIKRYIISAFENKRFYPMQDLPIIIGWRLESKGEEYTKSSLDTLINTYKCWITASQHIKEPDLKEVYDYSKDIDFETVNDYELLVKIILLIIASDDADAIRVALGGLAACLRVNIDYIEIIEKNWKRYHYQAKEWLIMIYEFLYRFCHDSREELYDLLAIHSQDEDFNVSLYSTLLCDNIDGKFLRSHKIVEKSFFADIPKSGNKLLIQTKNTNSWLSGQECVLKQIDVLESRLQIDLTDIERRTAEYSNIVKNEIFLIPLYRHKKGGAKVLCENVNIAFLRVLYKDWNDKRWYGNEAEIARGILSASEPITTLLSPQRWRWNNGVLFDNLHKLISLPEKERNSLIDNLFNLGVEENEIVLGGEIEDFTYNCELLAHMVSYFDFAGISKAQALQKYERNSRLFLKERSDYKEDWSPNIIIHQNGIQSFNQSLIMCGFSEFVLSTFKWKTVFKSDGLKIINERGEIIGRLECFYGLQSDIGNRNISNQPYMQRWVIASKALKEAIDNMKCSFSVEKVVGCIINNNIS